MVANGSRLPSRIEPDAILEALFEIRFDMVSPLEEVLFGRLAELNQWKGWVQRRLPVYDMPAAFREQDANLRYAPVFELISPQSRSATRVGGHVLSYHVRPPYVGWDAFYPQIESAIDGLFSKTEGLVVRRLGLRYINVLERARHHLAAVTDLDLAISVAQAPVLGAFNLYFSSAIENSTQCGVRVATRDFAQGDIPEDAVAIVDVDVYTVPEFNTNSPDDVKHWVRAARDRKNKAFFGLLRQETIDHLGRS